MKLSHYSLMALTCSQFISCTPASFDATWADMQKKYSSLSYALQEKGLLQRDEKYIHPFWKKTKERVQAALLGKPNKQILSEQHISNTMIRTGFDKPQRYEISLIKNCVNNTLRRMISKYKDSTFGDIQVTCSELSCSTNTLGHLYYAARTLDTLGHENVHEIVEIGGGYGNLTRIFKSLLPNVTIYIINSPEFLALQYLFLTNTLENCPVVMHTELPQSYTKGAIHLIPINFLEELELLDIDLCISPFSLTELTAVGQRKIVDKHFFNAKACYLCGQLTGSLGGCGDVFDSYYIQDAMRREYPYITCNPLHAGPEGNVFEIMGQK